MAVRFKLDRCGVKLSLRQWAGFTYDERLELLTLPCDTAPSIDLYRERLVDLLAARPGDPVKETPVDDAPEWANTREVPEQLRRHARALALQPPTLEQWSALTPLQRFALAKLARDGHENLNFIPAMREFGLLENRGR